MNFLIEVIIVHTEKAYIPDVYRALIGHLSRRGLMPMEIERLVEDAFSILGRGGTFTMASLNRLLESLGWHEEVVDTISFRLIIYLLEKEHSYEVQELSLH